MSSANSKAPGSRATVLGIGAYRPRLRVANRDLAEATGVDPDWISQRTGIHERGRAGPDETLTMMARAAGTQACERAGIDPRDIDCVIVATLTHTLQVPSLAPRLARELGCSRAVAFEISAACAGFTYGLALARDSIQAGTSRHVLVIGVERMGDLLDPTDPATAPIFGDGAGAAVVGPAPAGDAGIGPVVWGSDGAGEHAISMTGSWQDLLASPGLPAPVIAMDGAEIWRWVRRDVVHAVGQALSRTGRSWDQIDAFVPHQANARIIDLLARQLAVPARVVVAKDITVTGNTSAASIPLALDALHTSKALPPKACALLVGFGAGLTFAAQTVTLP